MICVLMAVGDFCDRVEGDMAGLTDELTGITGRTGEAESAAWRRSLPRLSVLLNHAQLHDFRIQSGQIADWLQQFDLVAILEFWDREVVGRALAILQARGQAFEALVSEPVGRGVLERYAFLWRAA